MSDTSAAVYDAAVAIDGDFEPYGPAITAPQGASVDAAVVEAAYRTLVNYFPLQAGNLGMLYMEALGLIPDGAAKVDGSAVGLGGRDEHHRPAYGRWADDPDRYDVIFPHAAAGPGVWRLTPPFAPPQTPWVRERSPIYPARGVDKFFPDPPPSLQSPEWVEAFNEVKAYGPATGSARTDEQTAIAKFWSANVIRQYNQAGRDVVDDARPWPARDRAVSGDDQPRGRRCSDFQLARQVPLLVLARSGDPGCGH